MSKYLVKLHILVDYRCVINKFDYISLANDISENLSERLGVSYHRYELKDMTCDLGELIPTSTTLIYKNNITINNINYHFQGITLNIKVINLNTIKENDFKNIKDCCKKFGTDMNEMQFYIIDENNNYQKYDLTKN